LIQRTVGVQQLHLCPDVSLAGAIAPCIHGVNSVAFYNKSLMDAWQSLTTFTSSTVNDFSTVRY